MQNYLISAAGVIFLSVIVTLLIPEGKLNKTITFAMRIICILVLIHPITEIFSIESTAPTGDFLDYEYVCGEYSEHQSAQLEKIINEKFSVSTNCFVEVEYGEGNFEVKSVRVEVEEKDSDLIGIIYEYLKDLKYINISVYAKSS